MKVIVAVLPILKPAVLVFLRIIYSYPSFEDGDKVLELRSLSKITFASVDEISMLISVIGIHLIPSILMGKVIPPKGKEYEDSSVVN